MSITTECMVANLSISVWSGHRIDKAASQKVTQDAGAESDAARVNKHLVPKETLKAVLTAQSALRVHFYANTLPWRDNGDRLLTRKRFPTFIAKHGELTTAFTDAVDTFVQHTYLGVRDQAAFRMGDLFNPDDYPPSDVLRRRFGVVLDIDAVTDANDFRVNLDKKHLEALQLEVQDRTTERLGRAMEHVWRRLADAVGHMAERLQDKDAVFRDSLVENLRDVVGVLPDLNILDDPTLERMRAEVEQKLTQFEPKELRKSADTRQYVAETAQGLFDEITGLMRAFGTGDE